MVCSGVDSPPIQQIFEIDLQKEQRPLLTSAILYSQIANNECAMQRKPQDILFLLKLVTAGDNAWSYNGLAAELGMSASGVHAAAKRAVNAGLAIKQGAITRPHVGNLTEFLVYGIRYVFISERGGLCTGLPTAFAARPFRPRLHAEEEPTPVRPDPEGSVTRVAFSPLYKSAPFAAKRDPFSTSF